MSGAVEGAHTGDEVVVTHVDGAAKVDAPAAEISVEAVAEKMVSELEGRTTEAKVAVGAAFNAMIAESEKALAALGEGGSAEQKARVEAVIAKLKLVVESLGLPKAEEAAPAAVAEGDQTHVVVAANETHGADVKAAA